MNRILLFTLVCVFLIGCGGSKKSEEASTSEEKFVQNAKRSDYQSDVDSLIKRGELSYLFERKDLGGGASEVYIEMLEVDGIEAVVIRDPSDPKHIEHNKKMLVEIEKKFGKDYLGKRLNEAKRVRQMLRFRTSKKEDLIQPTKVISQ